MACHNFTLWASNIKYDGKSFVLGAFLESVFSTKGWQKKFQQLYKSRYRLQDGFTHFHMQIRCTKHPRCIQTRPRPLLKGSGAWKHDKIHKTLNKLKHAPKLQLGLKPSCKRMSSKDQNTIAAMPVQTETLQWLKQSGPNSYRGASGSKSIDKLHVADPTCYNCHV